MAWGVHPIMVKFTKDPAKLHSDGMEQLKKKRLAKAGDPLIIITGTETARGAANSLRFERMK